MDANGNDVTSGIGTLNPFRYRGYYYDTETELYYLQTRYYDPEIGRFISQDSLEYADPETINGLNLYAYCGNNPVMNIDPSGHLALFFLISLIIGAVVGAVVGGYVAGKTASESGITGLELFGCTLLGVIGGGIIGGALGAGIGAAGAGLLGGVGAGSLVLAGGGTVATGVAVAGVALGINILFAQWNPGSWPGDDPTVPPGDGFIWRGPGEVGSEFGEWFNPETHDQLHPNLQHPYPKGPHWGWSKWRRFIMDIFKNL